MLTGNLKQNILGLKSKLEDLEKILDNDNVGSTNKSSFNKQVKKFTNSEDKISDLLEKDQIIKLNIGGKEFMTRASNLLYFKDSLFAKTLLESGPNTKELFFDRSFRNFKHILNFLRDKNINLKKLNQYVREDLIEESEFYGISNDIQISKKTEYDLKWDATQSKAGACTVDPDDPKILKVHSTSCYTHFVTDREWVDENMIVELESNVQQTDSYLYFGVVNESYNYSSNCMCCNPGNAFYVQCNGNIRINGNTSTSNIFNFESARTTIGMRINFAEKEMYFYIPDKGEYGPHKLNGNTFRIVSGHCNSGNGSISILSCYEA
jgi:hypothetical protein